MNKVVDEICKKAPKKPGGKYYYPDNRMCNGYKRKKKQEQKKVEPQTPVFSGRMTRQQSNPEKELKDQHVKQEQPVPNQEINSNISRSSDDLLSK